VIDFLEEDGEMVTFMEHVYALADPAVARYLKRGFTHLQFSFGCTGGQHRSVYGAQHLAQHLANTFGVQVRLNHREQNITQLFNCSNA
jgi:RNase adaptor protein for sRNA GlmZ degradation